MDIIVEENVDINDLKKLENVYTEQQKRGFVSEKSQFDYAWCLVRSRYTADMHHGIALLEDLLKNCKDSTSSVSQRDYLFYIAVGYVRLKEYEKALTYIKATRKIQPDNLQATKLEKYINSQMKKDGFLGMAIVGGAAIVVGGLIGATVAAIKKKK